MINFVVIIIIGDLDIAKRYLFFFCFGHMKSLSLRLKRRKRGNIFFEKELIPPSRVGELTVFISLGMLVYSA